jgi:hypothetical protein
MKKIKRSTEADVIAEFLKSEFYHEEFHADRETFKQLVMEADLSNGDENALRRALLFRRRGHMWRELPVDTQWWDVELEPDDLRFIRVFPRAQWRKIAGDSFLLRDIVHRIRNVRFSGNTHDFILRIQTLSQHLRSQTERSAVLLIGVDDSSPLTILEGNHRLTAALLAGPEIFSEHFRTLCGFSPNMSRSCWYETNLPNLWRYAQNRLRNLFYDRDADVKRVLRSTAQPATAPPLESGMNPVSAGKVAGGSK